MMSCQFSGFVLASVAIIRFPYINESAENVELLIHLQKKRNIEICLILIMIIRTDCPVVWDYMRATHKFFVLLFLLFNKPHKFTIIISTKAITLLEDIWLALFSILLFYIKWNLFISLIVELIRWLFGVCGAFQLKRIICWGYKQVEHIMN